MSPNATPTNHPQKFNSLVALALLTAVACTATVQAADIYSNPITDSAPQNANPFVAGQAFDPNITVGGLGRGPGVNPNSATNRYNARDWATTFDAGDYFWFKLTPNTGYEIDFNNITGGWQRSGTGPSSYAVRTSVDAFAADIASGAITGSGSESPYTIDLSTLPNITSEIEIRIYAWGGNNPAGTFSFNSFMFDGAVNPISGNELFAGDYNHDGVVDAADYVTWRSSLANATTLPFNETQTVGTTDQLDYDEWRAHFGNVEVLGGGAGSPQAIAVPEPTTAMLLLTLLAAAIPIANRR